MELKRRKDASAQMTRRGKLDTVGWYLEKIKNHEVLQHQKLVELFQRLESGDKSAMNEIVERNLKLVVAVARMYRDKGVDWEDLLQEGNLGLIHAIEKFEWRRGHKFSTYGTWWIRQRISHYLSTQRHSIRVPTHAMRLKKHIEASVEKLRREGVEEPTWELLAKMVDSSPDVVEATVSGCKGTISLSKSATSEREARENLVESTDVGSDPEAPLAFEQLRCVLRAAFDALEPLEKQIVQLRIGVEL